MIKFIAAIDDKKGLANDHGIPWLGKLPTDVKYYHDKVSSGVALMGGATYNEMSKPLPAKRNVVITTSKDTPKEGFEFIDDLQAFVQNPPEGDLWIIGGANVFAQTIDSADELYLTRVEGDFGCTKFFPEFEKDFENIYEDKPQTENGITFRFEVWKRRQS